MLTSNRDEHGQRPAAQLPRRYCIHERALIFPRDPQSGGTWIATAANGFSVCLLNGAFDKHVSQPPYRTSRGSVLLDFFGYDCVKCFVRKYDFTGIEPFTLLVVQAAPLLSLNELRWDGATIHLTDKDPEQPHIWSSVTLYEPPVVRQRERWYAQWLTANPDFVTEDVLNFHRFTGAEDSWNGLRINRHNQLQTVSITAIVQKGSGNQTMVYEDLLRQTRQTYRMF